MKSFSFSSGKGGVGKTTLLTNVAIRLAQSGRRVLILDADLGLANVDIFFAIKPEFHIGHFLSGEKTLSEIILEVAKNVFLIPGGSGIVDFNKLTNFERRSIQEEISNLQYLYDYLLIDCAAGIGESVLYFNSVVDFMTVVVTPDPASFTDAYAMIKIMQQKYKTKKVHLICNEVVNESDGLILFSKMNEIAQRFLNIGIDYLGSIPLDDELSLSVQRQRLIMKQHGQSPAVVGIKQITNEIEALNRSFELTDRFGLLGINGLC